MEKLQTIWDVLPKTVKVFIYLAISTILSEVLVELKTVDQTFLVRISAQLINLAIVLVQEVIPAIKNRIAK
jgi:hypothetical protein